MWSPEHGGRGQGVKKGRLSNCEEVVFRNTKLEGYFIGFLDLITRVSLL